MNNIISVSVGKIALYSTPTSNVYVDVIFKDETFWMTQKAISELFEVNIPAISKHLKNIFDEKELILESTVSKMEIVQNEGGRKVTRTPDFYNLDVIIAVGYRVNSKEATRFRQWATKTLKEYIQSGKGHISNEEAAKKAGEIYEQFRIKQDKDYISQFDRDMVKYFKGNGDLNWE